MDACACNLTLGNTGTPDCQPLIDVTLFDILVPMRNADGVANKIDLSATLNATLINGLINNADDKSRYFPLPMYENIESTRAESEFETANSGRKYKQRQGTKEMTAYIFQQSPTLLKQLANWSCETFGVLKVDKQGNLIGDKSESGYLKPIPVQKSTLEVIYVEATETTSPKIMIKYQYDQKFKDENLGMILASDFAADVDMTTVVGLQNLYGRDASSTTAAFTISIYGDFGSAITGNAITGLTASDVEPYNVTTAAAVTATVAESATVPGTYVFTYGSAQTSADVLYIRKKSTSTGWDDTNLKLVTATI